MRDHGEPDARAPLESPLGSDAELQRVIDQLRGPLWITTPDMRELLYASPAFRGVWGHDPEDLCRDPDALLRMVQPEDRERVAAALRTQADEGFDLVYQVQRPDGEVRWIHDRRFPVRTAAGVIQCIAGIADDVTDRRRTEQALREHLDRLREVLGTVGALAWSWDFATGEIWREGSLLERLGFEASTLPSGAMDHNAWWQTRVHPDDLQVYGAGEAAIRDGREGEARTEYRFRRADGSYATIGSTFQVERDAEGRPVRARGIEIDVSERAAAEEAGRESERRFIQIAEHTSEMFWLVDVDADGALGRLVYINPAYERITGRTARELYDSDALGLRNVAPDDLPRVLEAARAAVGGARRTVEYRLATAGRIRTVRSRLFPIRDGDGRVYRVGGVTEDITERRDAQAALLASEVRFETLVESAHEGVWTLDGFGRTTYANPRMAEMLKCSVAQLRNRLAFDFMDPPTAFRMRTRFARHQRGLADTEDIALQCADGTRLWVTVSASPLHDEAGTFTGVLCFVSDLTARRQVEEALRRSQARLEEAQQLAQLGSWELDVRTQEVVWSPGLFRLLGLEPHNEPISLDAFYAILHPDDREGVRESLRGHLAEGRGYETQFRVIRSDGATRVHRVVGKMVHDRGGALVRVIGTTQDVTEQAAAEEARLASERRFRGLIEHAQDVVAILGVDGILRYVSPSVVAAVGFTPEEMTGQPMSAYLHPEDLPRMQAALAEVQSPESTLTTVHYRCRHRAGGWRAIEATVCNRVDDPAIAGIVLNARDVTGQQALESQLRQSQKMEAVGQLAGGIAHDFNNLLTVIGVSVSFARETISPDAPVVEDLQAIDGAAQRAAQLTRQLLAFSRKQLLKPEQLDLNEVVRGLEPILGRLIGEDILVIPLLATPLRLVMVDPGQIEQVLVNLAVNARDAMPQGGRLVIETANVDLTSAEAARRGIAIPPGPYVRLTVRDTGVGMTPAVLDQIFDPFFTTKAPGKGSGLGLSTVYGVVKQSGGFVWVTSVPGRGTTFQVDLPAIPPTEGHDHDVAAQPIDALPVAGTILLVEDDAAVRSLTRRVLARKGYTVVEAENGVEGLRVAQQHAAPIDLVLTDVVMPEMSGREFGERVTAHHPRACVLYMTGYTDDEIVRRGLLAPGMTIVEKPFTPDRLLQAVRAALEARDDG